MAPRVGRHDDAVEHPLAFAPGRDDARVAQVGEVTRDLGLGTSQDLYEVADTDFLLSHEVEETRRVLSPSAWKNCCMSKLALRTISLCICFCEYVRKEYICLSKCIWRE